MKKPNILYRLILLGILFYLVLISAGCKDNKKTKSFSLNTNSITIAITQEYAIDNLLIESEIAIATIESSDSNVVLVDNDRLVGISAGTSYITIKASGYADSKVLVTVKELPLSLQVNAKSDYYVGDVLLLSVIKENESTCYDVEWSIAYDGNKELARIDNDSLVFLEEGTIYLTCTSLYNSTYATKKIFIRHHLLESDNYTVERITGGFGEDASSEYIIHYQAYSTKSKIYLTTSDDLTFSNASIYDSEGYYFKDDNSILVEPYKERNVINVTVNNLTPGTEYIYKINRGDNTYTDVYTFKTAPLSSSTSFIYLTDVHYSMMSNAYDDYPSQISEETIKKALEIDPSISFIVDGGDLIDTGGNTNIWDRYFKYAQSLKILPHEGVPGNHEYYMHITSQGDNRYFKAHNALPYNGVGNKVGSSYFFIYNDVLFIMLDTVKSDDYIMQVEWLEELLSTKEYKHSIVVHHIPPHMNNSDTKMELVNIYEKYAVDLVLSGHYHSESFTNNLYKGKTTSNDYLGCTYFNGGSSGAKARPVGVPIEDVAKGYIINVTDDNIRIRVIYANGKVEQEFNIYAKREFEVINDSIDNLINTVEYELDKTNNSFNVSWDSKLYGNIKRIEVRETLRNKLYDYDVMPTPAYTKLSIPNVLPFYDYEFEITLFDNFGNTAKKCVSYSLHEPINLICQYAINNTARLKINDITTGLSIPIEFYDIYLNNTLYSSGNKEQIILLKDLTENEYEVKLVFKDLYGDILFTESITISME